MMVTPHYSNFCYTFNYSSLFGCPKTYNNSNIALCIFIQEFIAQTLNSCEVLELSSSNLYVAAERLQTMGSSKEAKAKLVQASKDVLQGTMKVYIYTIYRNGLIFTAEMVLSF